MTTTAKRSRLLGAGVIIMIVGLLAALGLWYSASLRATDAVRNMARAPIGCDTTLDFEAGGEFFVFIESSGQFDSGINGDCGADGDYAISSGAVPAVSLSLTSPDGDDINLDSSAGISYDAGGFTGQSIRKFTIETPGDYQLRVQAPGSDGVQFAAAVGRDPADGVSSMQVGALLAGLAGLVVGGGLILMSRRSAGDAPVSAQNAWPTEPAGWPTSPPGAPAAPPAGAHPPVGPPTQYPVMPPAPPAPPAPPGGAPAPSWQPQPPPQQSPHPQPQPQPQPQPTSAAPSQSGWGAAPADGSSGDGQRSPWAPPSDSGQ